MSLPVRSFESGGCPRATIAVVTAAILAAAWPPTAMAQGGRQRETRRAQRPVFDDDAWEGIFFRDLFREGLVGEPPAAGTSSGQKAGGQTVPPSGEAPAAGGSATPDAGPAAGSAWSQLIDREVLEDQIKRVQIQLDGQLTSPGRFTTGYREVNWSFEMLATWFAIVMEYDGAVRWKEQAPAVVGTLLRAVMTTRKAGDDSYRLAVTVRDAMGDMIRGGSFNGLERPVTEIDWSAAANRTTIMKNLDVLLPALKSATASEASFRSGADEVLHGASLIAALGHVLARPGADTADDSGYVRLAKAMEDAAATLTRSVRAGDFPGAQTAVNQIEQSCTNCHGEWR